MKERVLTLKLLTTRVTFSAVFCERRVAEREFQPHELGIVDKGWGKQERSEGGFDSFYYRVFSNVLSAAGEEGFDD